MDFLSRIEKQLDLPPAERAEVLREIRSHYDEIKEGLISQGMTLHEAEEEAARRLGNPEDIASRLGAVHGAAGWKLVLLTIVPFPIVTMAAGIVGKNETLRFFYSDAALALLLWFFVGVTVAVSVRELWGGRRPIWLATWFAVAMYGVGVIPFNIVFEKPIHGLPWYVYQLPITVPVAVILIASWKAWKWTAAALVVAALYAGATARYFELIANPAARHLPPTQLRFVIEIAGPSLWLSLWILVGLRIFASHRYGSGAQTSLFAFSLFAFADLVGHEPVTAILALALSAAVCARASRWAHKMLALSAGFAIFMYLGALASLASHAAYPHFLMWRILWPVAFAVAIPVLYERWSASR